MNCRRGVFGLVVVLMLSGSMFCQGGSILGDTFHIEWDYPNSGTVQASTTLQVNSVSFWVNPVVGINGIAVGDGYIAVTNNTAGLTGAAFNGFKLTDLSETPGFNSFSLAGTLGNPSSISPALSFDADDLIVNFTPTGVSSVPGSPGAVYYFAFTVPEPGASLLLFLGAGLFLFRRYRRSFTEGAAAQTRA